MQVKDLSCMQGVGGHTRVEDSNDGVGLAADDVMFVVKYTLGSTQFSNFFQHNIDHLYNERKCNSRIPITNVKK